jgi:hypothetical protein
MQSGARFPLTLTLSPGEREQLSSAWEHSLTSEHFTALPRVLPAHEPPKQDIGNALYHSTLRRMAIFDHFTGFRGAKRVKKSGESLPEGEGRGEGESRVLLSSYGLGGNAPTRVSGCRGTKNSAQVCV